MQILPDYFLNKLETLKETNAIMFQPECITLIHSCSVDGHQPRPTLKKILVNQQKQSEVIRHTEHTQKFYIKINITISFLYLLHTFV